MTLAVGMWIPTLYLWLVPGHPFEMGNGLAGDFRFFYVLAVIAHRDALAHLYDKAAILELGSTLMPNLPGGFAYPSAYPPIVAVVLAPLGSLSYTWAATVWTVLTVGLYAWACRVVWRVCPALTERGLLVAICALAYPAFFYLVTFGQSSAPALLFLSAAYIAFTRDRRWLAGLAIGALAYKPQLGVGVGLVMLISREWRVVSGAITSGAILIGIGWWQAGNDVMYRYWLALRDLDTLTRTLEPKLYHLHSLRGFFSMLLPWPTVSFVAYLATSIVVLAVAARTWASPAPLAVRFSTLLLATVLVDPHLNVYDLVILVPMFLTLANWMLTSSEAVTDRRLTNLLVASFALPLIGPLAAITHVQLSVIAFCWLGAVLAAGRPPMPVR